MLVRKSVQLVGDASDDVLVVFDKDGTAHNELLRDARPIARSLRQAQRADREARKAQRAAVDVGHVALRTAQQTADDARAEALRAYEQAIESAKDQFQAAIDAAADTLNAAVDAIAAERSVAEENAFRTAEDAIAARDANLLTTADDADTRI